MGLGILLISYIITEFYLPNKEKNNKFSLLKLIIYTLIYTSLSMILLIYQYDFKLLIYILALGIVYYYIQILSLLINRISTNIKIQFFPKHILNIIIIILSALLFEKHTNIQMTSNMTSTIRMYFSFLLLGVPGNKIFKALFHQFKPEDNDELPTINNAGATIGILERFLIFICIINNLFTSIGLIFTAKSIARYKRINDEPAFSEYYLIGTLSSLLYTIIIYFTIYKVI